MKKIGILTWYKGTNYGSILQATALSSVINSLNYESVMINYLDKGNYDSEKKMNPMAYRLWSKILHKLKNRETYDTAMAVSCDSFIKSYLTETDIADTWVELRNISEKLDGVVCGSDQIWSPLCYDDNNFLPFVNPKKKMAYSPSLGVAKIQNNEILERMKKHISSFDYISVREKTGANLIDKMTGVTPPIVLDPTLLLNKCEWFKLLNIKDNINTSRPFIFCYLLGSFYRYQKVLERISHDTGYEIRIVCDSYKSDIRNINKQKGVGPIQFLDMINKSFAVVTDSFHCSAFSVNFHKPFLSLARFDKNEKKNQNSRILDFLEMTGFSNHFIFPNEYQDGIIFDVDFTKSDRYFVEAREDSISFLRDSLEKITESKISNCKPFNITETCCGCGACSVVCPTKAIKIEINENGFRHFRIDDEKCVNCRKCQAACPFYTCDFQKIREIKLLVAYRSNNPSARKSSSGGAGLELALYASKNGYYVFGSMYNSCKQTAEHICIKPHEINEINKIQSSKYIQSNTDNVLKIINELPENSKICFFGTPCQCAAVDHILRQKQMRESAIIIDLICHGVPSYNLWKKEIKYIEKVSGNKYPSFINFRGDYHKQVRSIVAYKDLAVIYRKTEYNDPFYNFYKPGICYTDACYECAYRNQTAADIRIGDYWGPRFVNSNQKTSMVCAVNEKGFNVIRSFRENASYYLETPTEEYWKIQTTQNTHKPSFYNALLEDLRGEEMIDKLEDKYCKVIIQRETQHRIIKKIRKVVHL